MQRISKSHSTPYFERKFERLSKNIQKVAAKKILLFEENIYHPSLNTHKLKGPLSGYWSFYINKRYRVLFRFLKKNEVIYYDIDTHDIYK